MALQTTTTVIINGKNVPYYERLTLTQGINDHNTLTLVCRIQDLPLEEGATTDMLGVLKTYTGGRVSIAIAPPTAMHDTYYTQEFRFKGVIFEIKEERQERGRGQLITFTINSPTMLMDHSKRDTSYLDRGIDDIVNETLRGYDADKLTKDIRPTFFTPLLYTVQDHCSDFEFLKRLARFYGQWLYYDGLQLIFGTPDTTSIPLEYGVNLKSISLKMTPTDTNTQFVTTDYLIDELHEKDSSEVTTSKEHLQQDIDQGAKQLFHKKNTQYSDGLYTDQNLANRFERQVEQQIKAKALQQATLFCTSDDTGIKLGSIVHIKNHGRYRVTQITHTNTHDGNYENSFEAIEASTTVYPIMDMHSIAKSESQTAIVKDNNDPKQLGRVKVQFAWQRKVGKTTPWIRVASSYAGADHGVYYIPEIGDEVMVQFEGGNAERPYVTHSLYNGVKKPNGQWFDPKNLVKGIHTPTGIQLVMNDKDKSFTLSDPSGNVVMLQGNGKVLIKAPESITLASKDLNFLAGNSINIIAKPGQGEDGQQNGEGIINVMAEKLIDIKAENETLTFNAKEEISLESMDAEISAKAKTKVTLDANETVNIVGKDTVSVNGNTETVISGGEVTINS